MTMFMRANGPTLFVEAEEESDTEELVLFVDKSLEDLCLTAGEDYNVALVDSACPTTVVGTEWVKRLNMSNLFY